MLPSLDYHDLSDFIDIRTHYPDKVHSASHCPAAVIFAIPRIGVFTGGPLFVTPDYAH
jgi:hypothetical protein